MSIIENLTIGSLYRLKEDTYLWYIKTNNELCCLGIKAKELEKPYLDLLNCLEKDTCVIYVKNINFCYEFLYDKKTIYYNSGIYNFFLKDWELISE